jgi:hypothetical protein
MLTKFELEEIQNLQLKPRNVAAPAMVTEIEHMLAELKASEEATLSADQVLPLVLRVLRAMLLIMAQRTETTPMMTGFDPYPDDLALSDNDSNS